MDDVINRADAIDVLDAFKVKIENGEELPYSWARKRMSELPSAQKTGRWEDGRCSVCGCDVPAYIVDWKWQKDMDANFCPNCGSYNVEVES